MKVLPAEACQQYFLPVAGSMQKLKLAPLQATTELHSLHDGADLQLCHIPKIVIEDRQPRQTGGLHAGLL